MYRPFLLHRPLSPPLAWLGLSVLIFAACLVGIFARPIGFLSVFWPANALLLGLLVRYPRLARPPAWVAAAVGYVAADLVTGSSWSMALWLNGANLLGATAGWLVLRRLDERIRRLQRTISALYLLLAALAASAVGALAGCGAAPVYFNSPWTDLLSLWFSTELMNYMLIVPVVLAAPRADDPPPATQEVPLIWRVAPVSSLLLAEGVRTVIGGPGMLAFVVPGLLWCALSYSPFVSSLLSLVVCLWTMAGVATGVLNFTPAHASDVFSLRVGVTLLALGPLAVACASAVCSSCQAWRLGSGCSTSVNAPMGQPPPGNCASSALCPVGWVGAEAASHNWWPSHTPCKCTGPLAGASRGGAKDKADMAAARRVGGSTVLRASHNNCIFIQYSNISTPLAPGFVAHPYPQCTSRAYHGHAVVLRQSQCQRRPALPFTPGACDESSLCLGGYRRGRAGRLRHRGWRRA